MNAILALCKNCDKIALSVDEIVLTHFPEAEHLNTYSFTCVQCSETTVRPADGAIYDLLITGGVLPRIRFIPDEWFETQMITLPALTTDDLLDFCLRLHVTDDLASELV